MKLLPITAAFSALFLSQANAQRAPSLNEVTFNTSGTTQITAEIWVDNWFALWINGKPLHQDSVAYKTERSFNAERVKFNATLPLTVAFEFRDFMENDTGLEYIGSRKQQMGDGGAIAQFMNTASGAVLLTTNSNWRCLVVQHAPIKTKCANESDPIQGTGSCASRATEIPTDWTASNFDDSGWATATAHSESAVRPKDGFDQISWDRSAELIWGKDLERDNILLCRATINK